MLLSQIEKTIVEESPGNPVIGFEQLALNASELYGADGFKLQVTMLLDGVKTHVDYHFNMKSEAVYCDNTTLDILDKSCSKEPNIISSDLKNEMESVAQEVIKLGEKGKALAKEIRALIASSMHHKPREATELFKQRAKALQDDDKKSDEKLTPTSRH